MPDSLKPWDAKKIRYIKLGRQGLWWKECLSQNTIRLGFGSGKQEVFTLAQGGDVAALTEYFRSRTGTPTAHANQTLQFFEDDGETLWVTFEDGMLHYGFAAKGPVTPVVEADGETHSFRQMDAAGWRHVDAKGAPLRMNELSGRFTKTAGYRQTICAFTEDVEKYLRDRLACRKSPELARTENARREMTNAIEPLIQKLTWKDFEILVELIFAQSGWRRVSSVGNIQKTLDIDLENPVTGDRAFVQVKSSTSQVQLNEYIQRLNASDYDRMFYVYHTGTVTSEQEDVSLWDVKKVADQVISNGLVDWVMNHSS